MFKFRKNMLYSSEIANYLNTEYIGEDQQVHRPGYLGDLDNNMLVYFDGVGQIATEYKLVVIAKMESIKTTAQNITYIFSSKPRVDFYKIVNEFFVHTNAHIIETSATISDKTKIGINVHIGKNSIIDEGAVIGNNSYIGNNVVISGDVAIGSNCIIKDGAIIGAEGFAFLKDDDETIYLPQFGRITIGDNVWIGANTTIERPHFETTKICSGVKIDDLCHIGQGVCIGKGTEITAGVILSRNVSIGSDAFIGINSTVRDNVSIGNNTTLGMGSVVVSDLPGNGLYIGSPAKKLKSGGKNND